MILLLLLSVSVVFCDRECAEKGSPTCASAADYKLGPDYGSEHCTADSCDIPGSVLQSRNVQPPGPNSKTEDEDDSSEVSEREGGGVLGWDVFSTISNVFSNVKSTVRHTIYKKATEYTENIYENVRSAIQDEIFYLLEAMWGKMITPVSDPDTWLGKLTTEVANRVMAVGLVVLCVFLKLIFWQLNFSIFFMLAIDGTILLMYKLLGPRRVYSLLWKWSGYLWYLISFILAHPYIFAAFIVCLFVASMLWPVYKYFQYQKRENQTWTIEKTVLNLSDRFTDMERKQDEILSLLKELKQHIEPVNQS